MPDLQTADYFNKRIIGFLNWKGNRKWRMTDEWREKLIADFQAAGPDHIAVTGDITNLALEGEFDHGRSWLESMGQGSDISVIPGNHDAYVRGAFRRHGHLWAPYMAGDGATVGEIDFPYLRRRAGVALIGASSGVAMPPLVAAGLFGRHQARRLRKLLSDPAIADDFKVVMIHHPPNKGATMRINSLIDARLFRRVIRKCGADLILHGHTHLATVASIPGPRGPVPVLSVPAASNGIGLFMPAARYNLFEIERTGEGWSCLWTERGFEDPTGELVTFRDRMSIDSLTDRRKSAAPVTT